MLTFCAPQEWCGIERARGQVQITCGYEDPLAASGPVYSRSAVWKTHRWARWGIKWCKDVVTEFVTVRDDKLV